MASLRALLALLPLAVLLSSVAAVPSVPGGLVFRGYTSHEGGACQFKPPFPPSNIYAAGISSRIFRLGDSCGKCFELECVYSKYCNRGAKVVVTVTNECSSGSGKNASGPCIHGAFNLEPGAFDVISHNPNSGPLYARFKPVACSYKGPVQAAVLVGNNYYLQLLVQQVAGPGNLKLVEVSTNGRTFAALSKGTGSIWQLWNYKISGRALSLRLTGYNGQKLVIPNAIPANWKQGKVYNTTKQF